MVGRGGGTNSTVSLCNHSSIHTINWIVWGKFGISRFNFARIIYFKFNLIGIFLYFAYIILSIQFNWPFLSVFLFCNTCIPYFTLDFSEKLVQDPLLFLSFLSISASRSEGKKKEKKFDSPLLVFPHSFFNYSVDVKLSSFLSRRTSFMLFNINKFILQWSMW